MSTKHKIIKHGNHVIYNNNDGYMYSLNITNGYDFNSHIHNCYEFIHILNGQLIYTVEGSEYMLCDGDVIMTNPEELHSFSFPKDCEYHREFLHVYPGFIKDFPLLTKTIDSRTPGTFNRLPAALVKKYGIDTIFNGIEECCSNLMPETDFLVLTYTLQLITKISQMLRNETFEKQNIVKNKKANAVCNYIDHHFRETISVASIANSLYVSPSHLSRVFKSETGMTIKAYMNMRRITYAKNLIVQGQKIIKTIYPECGYSDYTTFYRAFIKYTGMSPDEFKAMHGRRVAI